MSISRWPSNAALSFFLAGICFGQPVAFDAASVKAVDFASHPVFDNSGGPGTADAGRIHLCCVGMYALLTRAYDIDIDQIAGPSWIVDNVGPNLYRVDATMSPGTTKAQYQIMMQNLLTERFHLTMHRESWNLPACELAIAKGGPKLKESETDERALAPSPSQPHKRSADGKFVFPPGPQMITALGRDMVHVQAQQKPLSDLVKGMGRLIAESQGADPGDFASPKARVIERTGLSGTYDFTLEFACEGCRGLGANLPLAGQGSGDPAADPASTLPNIFGALEKQLGMIEAYCLSLRLCG